MSDKLNIAVITNVIPQYREDMYHRLVDNYGNDFHVFCQDKIPGMNLNTVHKNFNQNVTIIKALSLQKEKLCWQFLPAFKIIKQYDVVFVYGNPRVLSNVIWSLILKTLGKKVVVWGQFHTASSSSLMKKIRLWWWGIFDFIFLYTDKEAEQYRHLCPDVYYVTGMNNGVNQNEVNAAVNKCSQDILDTWAEENDLKDKVILLSCARLDIKNQFEMVIESLPDIIKIYPDILWCVIGDGDVKSALKEKAEKLGVAEYIKWLGPIYSQDKLAPWFLSARCLIHPGSIGLSLMHAMGYGLPVVTHDNESHQMPEIAALIDGENGLLFREGDKSSLIEKILLLIGDKELSKKLSSHAKQTVADNYNTKIMAEKFIGMVNKTQEKI